MPGTMDGPLCNVFHSLLCELATVCFLLGAFPFYVLVTPRSRRRVKFCPVRMPFALEPGGGSIDVWSKAQVEGECSRPQFNPHQTSTIWAWDFGGKPNLICPMNLAVPCRPWEERHIPACCLAALYVHAGIVCTLTHVYVYMQKLH